MKKCKIKGVSEGDIKIITAKLAKTDEEFMKISAFDMGKTEITSGSKGVILEILEEYRKENINEPIIEEETNCDEGNESEVMGRKRIVEDAKDREGEVEKGFQKTQRNTIVYRRQKLNGNDSDEMSETSSEEEEIRKHSSREKKLRRIDTQLMLRTMERKETHLEWLIYATHYLDTFDVAKSEKLVILKRFMT